jgi:ABC-type sugar transport system substrate-binding protein
MKDLIFAKVFIPAIAILTMALGSIPGRPAQPKIKIGVTMAVFDDVWLTNVRDAMNRFAAANPGCMYLIESGVRFNFFIRREFGW